MIIKKIIIYLFLGFLSIVSISLLAYYFVLPSVFSNNKEIRNILIVSNNLDEQNNNISLAHLSPNQDDNLIISINGNQIVNVDGGYGEYSLSTIYQLLKIDNQSDQKIKSVFSSILSIAIDDVVVANGFFEKDSINNKINLLEFHSLSSSMEVFNFDRVSQIEKFYYKLSTLEEEVYNNCSVSVLNTTPKNGLAKRVSEIIENTGAQVMQIEGSDSQVEKTIVYYPFDRKDCAQLVNKISGIFPVEVLLKSSDELSQDRQFRSNVIVIIGEDY